MGGSQTWTVPTIAGEIARAVTPYDWDRGRRTIESAIQAGDNVPGHRVQQWWQKQWSDPNSQYAVRVLTPEERAVADEMVIAMESMRPMGFLNVKGELRDHPDARAVCETVATQSTLFVTKDDATLVPAVINAWIEQHAPHWGVHDAPAVVDVEEAMLQWAKDEPRGLAEVALLAYWPEDRNASDSAVIKQNSHAFPIPHSARLCIGHRSSFNGPMDSPHLRFRAIQSASTYTSMRDSGGGKGGGRRPPTIRQAGVESWGSPEFVKDRFQAARTPLVPPNRPGERRRGVEIAYPRLTRTQLGKQWEWTNSPKRSSTSCTPTSRRHSDAH